jgi:dihydroneopterin aldolase
LFTIHLSNLKFFSFHGVHDEEKVLGGEFIVDAVVYFTTAGNITTLEQTVDYCKIYDIIKQRMSQPSALLETVAQDLAVLIYATNSKIISVKITITKSNPPIQQFSGNIAVSYKKDF